MKNILFYISGHGYGHAVRTAEIARALCESLEDVSIEIRTTAPVWLFEDLIRGKKVKVNEASLDPGVVEENPLKIDAEKSVERLVSFLKTSLNIVSRETAYAFQNNVHLIVSDIPSLAGEVASRLDVPCLAASNFLWDWIYEPLIFEEDYRNAVLLSIRTGYSKMTEWMRYPFYHSSSMFNKITDVSLVVKEVRNSAEAVQERLGLDTKDKRLKVYIAFRGGIDENIVVTAAENSPDFLFLFAEPTERGMPENVKVIQPFPEFSFADVVNMCDVVVGKPGYGLMSLCAAYKKRLIYPYRYGFREDDVMLNEVKKYTAIMEIPHDEFFSGRWNRCLDEIIQMEIPQLKISITGAKECAQIISNYL